MVIDVQPIRDRMRVARVRDRDTAVAQRTITRDEAAKVKAAADAVAAAIAVNDFAPEELTSRGKASKGEKSFQATSQATSQPTSDQPVELPPPEPVQALPPPQAAE